MAATITGTVYTDEGVTNIGLNKTVAISINGAAAATTDDTDASGAYSVTTAIVAGNVVTLYLDGETEKAVTVTVSDGNNATIDLYQNRLIVRHDNSGSLTNTNLDTADNNADADISAIYSVASGTLTMVAGKELFIWTGKTYAPGGNVKAQNVDINGVFTMGTNSVQVYDSWDATGGTFSGSGTGKVMFTGTTSSKTITSNGNHFNNLIVNDGLMVYYKFDETTSPSKDSSGYGFDGTWTSAPTTTTSISSTINFNDSRAIILDGIDDTAANASFAWPANTGGTVGGPVTVAFWNYVRSVDVQGSSVFDVGGLNSPNRFQVHTPWSDGTLYWDYGDTAAGTGRISLSYVAYLNKWTHVTLTSQGNGGSRKEIFLNGVSVASAVTSDGPNVALTGVTVGKYLTYFHKGRVDDFRIYNRVLSNTEIMRLARGNMPATGLGTYTLQDALTVDGTLRLNAGTLDVAGTNKQVNVAGNWENFGGIFVERAGTVILDGTDQEIPASETFYNISKTLSSATPRTITFGSKSTMTVSNTLTLQGFNASSKLLLRSSSVGTRFKISPTAGVQTESYLDIKDSEILTNDIRANGSTNSGNTDKNEAAPHWVIPLRGAVMSVE